MVVVEATSVKHRLAARADGSVQRVADYEVHAVGTIDQRRVHAPSAQGPGAAAADREILDLGVDQRQETGGVDRDDIAIIQCTAKEAGRGRIPVLIAGPAVEAGRVAEVVPCVCEGGVLADVRLAVPRIVAVECCLARVERAADQWVLLTPVWGGTNGLLLVQNFPSQGQETVLTEREADPAIDVGGLAICAVILGLVGDGEVRARRGWRDQGADVRNPGTIGSRDSAAAARFAQTQVQHAGNSI